MPMPGKDFFGGYCYMSQGPLPVAWAETQAGGRGLWGQRLLRRDGEVQSSGGAEDRGRVPATGAQPGDLDG